MGCTPSKATEKTGVVEATKAPEKVPTPAEIKKQQLEAERLQRIGVSAEPLPDFVPNPGFVIKSRRTNTFQKAFINVMHHEIVPTTARFVTRDEQWKKDKKGESCCVFTAIMPSETYAEMMRKPMSQPEICAKIINLINDLYPLAKLDLEYTMPKIHSGHMGEEIDFISSNPNAPKTAPAGFVNPGTSPPAASAGASSTTTAAPGATAPVKPIAKAAAPAAAPAPALVNPHLTLQRTQAEEKARLVHVPPKMQGWLKKKGHIVVNWKTRYFVLDSGYLTYFVDQLDVPPFGKDRKGQVSLAGYRVEQFKPLDGSATLDGTSPSELQYRIQLILTDDSYQLRAGKVGEYKELILEAASLEEKLAWLAAINAHTHYIESSLQIAAQVEKATAAAAGPAPAPAPAPASVPTVTPVPTPPVPATGSPTTAFTARKSSATPPAVATLTASAAAETAVSTTSATTSAAVAAAADGEIPVPPTPNISVNTPSAAALSLAASVPAVAPTVTAAATTTTTAAHTASVPPPAVAPAAVTVAPTAVPAPTVAVTATNDPKPWMVYVNSSLQETIVLCGVVNKPNPMGKQMLRELILTSRKRLIYVDSASLEAKGEIDWNNEANLDHFVKIVNPTTFEVHSATESGKVYKFITKDDLTAQHWVDAINSVKKPSAK